jgi:iron complex outermembrane recepter protein
VPSGKQELPISHLLTGLEIIRCRLRAEEQPHQKKKGSGQEIKTVPMIRLFGLTICVIFISTSNAQITKGRISLSVQSEQKQAIENATAELLKPDSSLVKAAISDGAGNVLFENIPFGKYRVRSSMVHHIPTYSQEIVVSAENALVQLPPIILMSAGEIQGVTVEAKKPFIQRLTDRIVVNVENSIISSGSSALDVLERSPGVRIGQDDAISLAGKQGVIIMINGKNVPMSGEELGNYLRSLPSSAIERIDIITNPSARYDAAGNAGIIDIRMKKDQKLGVNGTVTAGYGQGIFPKANTGATFNYRSKKLNVFGNLNYNYGKYLNNITTQRYFYANNTYTGSYDQDNKINRIFNSSLARIGADYFAGKKTVIGILVTGNQFFVHRYGSNQSQVLDPTNQKISSFRTGADGNEDYQNYVVNFNFKHSFDSTGKELTADFDVAGYYRDWASLFSTGYYDKNDQPTRPLYLARSDQEGFTGINTLKIDYVHPVNKTMKLETGIKTSFVASDNDVLFYDQSSGIDEVDSSKSNSFNYDENINAAYVNLSKEWKKWSVQFGLRAEQTNIKTYQVFDKVAFDTTYLRLFPSLFINYKLKEDNTIGISVSRRIDRPGYNSLNPFKIFVDPSFYASGDPLIKPAFTWSTQLSYTRKQWNVSLDYSYTTNPLTYVLIPSETEDRVTIQTPINFYSAEYLSLNLNAPIRITKWWSMINNGNIYLAFNRGYIAKTVVNSKTINGQFSTDHSITIAKNWTGEVDFTFDSGNNTGVMRDKFYWILGAGVQRSLMSRKATVRVNVTDILWKQWPRFRSIYTNYHEYLYAIRDTRVANLTFTYRFGKNTVTQARRRTTASEEERRRAGS